MPYALCFIIPNSAFPLPNSNFCPLSSVICYLSSVLCYLSSVICYLLSVLCHLPSAICLLTSEPLNLGFSFQQRKSHFFPLFQIPFRTPPGKVSNPTDITGALGNADRTPGIQKIKRMRAFQAEFISRENEFGIELF